MRDLTKCPKCGSERIAAAPDEAPPWATQWTKCFACGKRWNLGGPPTPRSADAEESVDDTSAEPLLKRTGEDIVKLVMFLSRKQPAVQTKETTMGKWSPEAREQHKKKMKDIWAKKRAGGGMGLAASVETGKPKRKYTFRNRQPTSVPQLPSTRVNASIVLADPTMVNGLPRRMDLDGNVLTVLDGLIQQREAELVLLRGTKEILERHG